MIRMDLHGQDVTDEELAVVAGAALAAVEENETLFSCPICPLLMIPLQRQSWARWLLPDCRSSS